MNAVKIKVWVLTRAINEYNQDGDYFVAVFGKAPSGKNLIDFDVPEDVADHVLSGGGRVMNEREWYFLREIELESV